MPVFERGLLASILIIAGVLVWSAYNRISIRQVAHTALQEPLLATARNGVPIILYFTTPMCQPCRTIQQPVLAELQAEYGPKLQVIQVDASEQTEAADRWGVFSAPTTFILDRHHTPLHVNRGIASAQIIKKQLSEAWNS